MNAQTTRKFLSAGFTLILVFIQSGCTGAAQSSPTKAVVLNTSTPTATFTPANTPTLEATTTLTSTPLPTATFTPNVTATQIPEVTPAVEGKGNVIGLVLWDNQPVAKAAIWLCEDFSNGCTGTYQYKTNTDKNGYYIFKNVTPGKYLVAINSFSTSWFIFYFDAQGSKMQNVSAGKDLILDPWSIWKLDLTVAYPRNGKAISEASPTFKWDAYHDATYYQFSMYDKNGKAIVDGKRVDGNEFTPDKPLSACTYYWYVEAFNAQGIKISENKPPDIYSTEMYFIDIDLPTAC